MLRPATSHWLVQYAEEGMILLDDAQDWGFAEVQECIRILTTGVRGQLYDLSEHTCDEYGRTAKLFVGRGADFLEKLTSIQQSWLEAHLLS